MVATFLTDGGMFDSAPDCDICPSPFGDYFGTIVMSGLKGHMCQECAKEFGGDDVVEVTWPFDTAEATVQTPFPATPTTTTVTPTTTTTTTTTSTTVPAPVTVTAGLAEKITPLIPGLPVHLTVPVEASGSAS